MIRSVLMVQKMLWLLEERVQDFPRSLACGRVPVPWRSLLKSEQLRVNNILRLRVSFVCKYNGLTMSCR